jgi:hypothetical protein
MSPGTPRVAANRWRPIARIRAWYWERRWMRHGRKCRACQFAAESISDVETLRRLQGQFCEEGYTTALIAALAAGASR